MPHNMEPETKAGGGGGASNQASGGSQEGVSASADQDKPLPVVMVPEKASLLLQVPPPKVLPRLLLLL